MACFKNASQVGSPANKWGSPITINKLIALVMATLNLFSDCKNPRPLEASLAISDSSSKVLTVVTIMTGFSCP